ncbi:hypothetical protein C0991_008866 [Blastosporella zonata]|nr:hypothetical protein C0991_008866 [Blastosporella zonata]
MSDSVAERSGFLRKYMSGHPDTLVAYAKWFGKVTEPITSAEMTSIDSKDGSKKAVYVPIEPPLKGYDDVKPRLLDMKATAQEKLGMIKAPQINSFHYPPDALKTGLFMATLFYFFFVPTDGSSPLYEPAKFVHSTIGSAPVNYLTYLIGGAHVLESVYTFTLCRKHTGFFTGALYVLNTMALGFPIWQDLRKRIQTARIDSVMKAE